MSKLYTEKEIRKFFNSRIKEELTVDELISKLTPIELPSNEEMEMESNKYESFYAFFFGAKWMRDKIQGGDNG